MVLTEESVMAKKTTKKKASKKKVTKKAKAKTKKRPKRSPVETSSTVDPVVAEASERVLSAEADDAVQVEVEAGAENGTTEVAESEADEVCYFEIGLRASVVDRVRALTNGEDDLEAKIAGLVEQALSETTTPASGNLIDEALIGELDPDFQEAHAELLRREY